MSFGNRPSEKNSKPKNGLPKSPELNALNNLGGLSDLASGKVGNLGKDASKLNKDLGSLKGGKNLNALPKALNDAGKLNQDAGNLLGSLNNFAGDLGIQNNQQKPKSDFENLANPRQSDTEDPRSVLNDLGTVGSLASAKPSGDVSEPNKGSLNDLNQLNNDLKHPQKIKDPIKDLSAAKNLKDGGLGALGFGPLEGPTKNALAEGFGHDPLMDKVADGSIKPQDLNNGDPQQRRSQTMPRKPSKGLLGHVKDGAHKVGRSILNGAKSGFSHLTNGIIGGVHALTGKTIAATVAAKAAAATLALPVMIGGGAVGALYHNYNDYQVLDDGNVCAVANTNGTGYADSENEANGNSAGAGGSGDMKTGGIAKKHAGQVFKSWVNLGFSGLDAAGIVGWVNTEGGFSILDRAEGHNGGDEKTNGIAYGVTPSPVGGGYSVGGAGIYQFTPYTKFAEKGDKKWLSADAQNKFVLKSLKANDWNPAMDLSGKNRSFKEWLKSDNISDAVLGWNGYERGNANKDTKIADAKWAYKTYHGSEYKLRESLLGSLAGDTADMNAAVAEKVNDLICKAQGGSGNGGPVVAGKWAWPFPGFKPSMIDGEQDFGPRSIGWHDGIDIGTSTHQGAIRAIHGGKVVEISCKGHTQNDLGYNIVVQSPDGWSEVYQEFAFSMEDGRKVSKVKEGDTVKTGQVICELKSSTPNCTHIHIGVYHGTGKQLMSDGWSHSFVPDYPGWKDPIKTIQKGLNG